MMDLHFPLNPLNMIFSLMNSFLLKGDELKAGFMFSRNLNREIVYISRFLNHLFSMDIMFW